MFYSNNHKRKLGFCIGGGKKEIVTKNTLLLYHNSSNSTIYKTIYNYSESDKNQDLKWWCSI